MNNLERALIFVQLLSVRPFVCLSVRLYVCLSVYLSCWQILSFYLSLPIVLILIESREGDQGLRLMLKRIKAIF